MTRQEMFDKAYLGVMAQGCASYDTDRQLCMYRGPNGTACGVGQLLDDETAKLFDDQEHSAIRDIVFHATDDEDGDPELAKRIPAFVFSDVEFLDRLQCAHDSARAQFSSDFAFEFDRRMREVARKYGLTVPEAGK